MNTELAIRGLWINILSLWGWMSWHFWSHIAAIVFWIFAVLVFVSMIKPAILLVLREESAKRANREVDESC